MPIDWTPFVALVKQHQRFLITTHVRPDPDGLGSQLALADVLEGMGRQVQMVIASSWPPRYTFLDPERRIGRFGAPIVNQSSATATAAPSVFISYRQLND